MAERSAIFVLVSVSYVRVRRVCVLYVRVKKVVVEQIDVDESKLTDQVSFEGDLDADSLDLIDVIMGLEDHFGIKISDEDAQDIKTVGQVVDYIQTHAP